MRVAQGRGTGAPDPFWQSSRVTCTLNSMRHLIGENFKALFLRARLGGNHEVFKK